MLFWILATFLEQVEKPQAPKEQKIKISLKEMPPKEIQKAPLEEKVEQTPIAPPMPKGSQLKEIVEAKPIKYDEQKKPKKPKLNPKSKITKVEPKRPEPAVAQKPFIPLKEEKKVPKTEDPFAWMHEDKSNQEEKKEKITRENGSSLTQNIKELYGDEFGKLTPGQQKYILDNQEIMRRITQETLNRVASVNLSKNLNVNTSNVVEFFLHPNGDMSDFKFLSKSGYYELDDTTKETIEYSYSKYPRPNEKILIRYNVFYNLAHR